MNDLGTAMRDVAEHVDVRAGFVGDVLRGGRRRQARRHAGVAVTMAVVIGIVGFGAGYAVRNWPSTPRPEDRRLLEATRGNLAGDPTRLSTTVLVWQRSLTSSWKHNNGIAAFRGDPHVYWAATTAVGDTAVVMQEAEVEGRVRTVVGLVGRDPADGVQKLLGATSPGTPDRDKESFQFGPGDRTFLVVDPVVSAYASASSSRDADGVVVRTWQEVPIVDGVGLWTTPNPDPSTARLVSGVGPPTAADVPPERQLTTYPASAYLRDAHLAQPNGAPPNDARGSGAILDLSVGPAGSGPPARTDVVPILRGAGLVDIGPLHRLGRTVHGTTPDGTGLVVGEWLQGTEPRTAYAVLFRPDGMPDRAIRGPVVDSASPVPVRLRLPDGHGWVIASDESGIRYRTSDTADWQGSFDYAAVIPDAAVAVEVAGQVVPLTR
ncbi:hypothetical protein [Umezawaea sp. NPDC059074]|uniref:hypothetical protein n=1 Tax=Umezawaea sp. NPDC059074 TaxID=3346716 RepID=UPI00367781D8